MAHARGFALGLLGQAIVGLGDGEHLPTIRFGRKAIGKGARFFRHTAPIFRGPSFRLIEHTALPWSSPF